jgi:4-amino-4-deoxy-L-arabinose transferase-like glycosyltransferase
MNKLIDTFKAIYLRHPYLLILFVSIMLTLPWITMGEFYTKGEPREATVATCILNTGNWVLPSDYADEVAYKPPFMHWFMAVFSLPAGHVTETTARLPSALGLIGITLMFFVLLYKRTSSFRAMLAALILLTSFEMHRSGIEARVDMTLAFFMIAALISLFKWEEKGLKGFPLIIPVFLGGAALVKGPVGILLPCLVFGIYLLLLQRYSLWKIIYKNVLVALPALAILLIWYLLAYQQGGEHFLKLVYAENFGRFLGEDSSKLGISYDLGHKGPFWYYIPAIMLGFMPWSLLPIFWIFTNSYRKSLRHIKPQKTSIWHRLANMEKLTLFSIVSVVIILSFYAIPSSKRSVYIMPAYPFAAYLLTQLYEWALDKKTHLIKLLTRILMGISGILLLLIAIFHFVDLSAVATPLIHDAKTLHDVNLFSVVFQHPTILGVVVWLLLAIAFCYTWIILKEKTPQIILVSALVLFICTQVFLEGLAFPVFKDSYSSRFFAEKVKAKYDLKDKTYVMNDLSQYLNLYGLNFYMGNNFKNFDKEQPSDGYFLTAQPYIDKIRLKYAGKYTFEELESTPDKYNDFGEVIVLYRIIKVDNSSK